MASDEKSDNGQDIQVKWTNTIGSQGDVKNSALAPTNPQKIEQILIACGDAIDSIDFKFNNGLTDNQVGGTGGSLQSAFVLSQNAAVVNVSVFVGGTGYNPQYEGFCVGIQFTTSDSKLRFFGNDDSETTTCYTMSLPGPLVQINVLCNNIDDANKNKFIGRISFGFIDWIIGDLSYEANTGLCVTSTKGNALTTVYVVNQSGVEQQTNVTLAAQVTQITKFTGTWGVQIAVGTEVNCCLAMFVNNQVQIQGGSYTCAYGESDSIVQTCELTPTITVPPNTAIQATLICDQGSFAIDFTVKLSSVLGHETTSGGIYGVNSCYNLGVIYKTVSTDQIPANAKVNVITQPTNAMSLHYQVSQNLNKK